MRTIFSIFHNDIRSILKNFFILVIVIAICALPALYAWINIYAAWDPYVNTGNVKVALSSRDTGVRLANGTHVNRADEAIADALDNDKICYIPIDDPDEAIEGVKAGDYYAAIVFEDGFSYDMENLTAAVEDEDPKVTFYPNIKKNGIGTKMTTSAANSLLKDINDKYLTRMLRTFFGDSEELADSMDLDTEEAVDDAIRQLTLTRDALHDFNQSVGIFLKSSSSISSVLKSTENKLDSGRSKSRSDMKKAKRIFAQAKKDLKAVSKGIRKRTDQLSATIAALDEVAQALKQPIDEQQRQKLIDRGEKLADEALTILQDLRSLIPDKGSTQASKLAADILDLMIDGVENAREDLENPNRVDELITEIRDLKAINDEELLPALKLVVADVKTALKLVKPLLSSARVMVDRVDPVLGSAGKTMSSMDRTMLRLQATLGPLEDRLNDIIDEVQQADDENRASVLVDMLGGDPDRFTSYFTSPVEVVVEKFYPIDTYGMAMAPFYTIIAIWVGGVMLTTILQTNANRRRFPQATDTQRFFGRFLIFFILGQLQAAVIVLGDIFLLHITPVHPWLMWLAAAVASLVFNLLIYALVLSFGNIGRAVVIVIMMLQIAGSSGTYPIEILPPIFAKIYKFFPFPYGINAVREAICGLYHADYVIYLGQLLVFAVLALAIGLLIRRPFMGVDRYVNEKLEETEVL